MLNKVFFPSGIQYYGARLSCFIPHFAAFPFLLLDKISPVSGGPLYCGRTRVKSPVGA
jgi:hypothetical protein